MGHDHHHDHTVSSLNKAFILGITLNVAFVVVEFAVGLYYGSMGLLSDAGHNLSDVASLLLAMLAFRLAQVHATPRYTYGYKKSTVLISLLNSVILLIAVGIIVAESIGRMMHPAPIEGGAIACTAGVGVAINGFTAWLFMKDKDKDLNVKGAYLHMAADALVSVGVLVSGLVISWTGWTIVDPIVGLIVAAVIVASVWSLTRASLRLSLDGVPDAACLAADGSAVLVAVSGEKKSLVKISADGKISTLTGSELFQKFTVSSLVEWRGSIYCASKTGILAFDPTNEKETWYPIDWRKLDN